ncbi:MAG: vWA domain-containing protein, partial [Myxococcaceae bacterium]
MDRTDVINANGQSDTRMNVTRNAVKQITASGGDKFRYGLELFGLNTLAGCGISSPTCSYPNPTTCQSVLADFNVGAQVAAVLDPLIPQGGTPTWTAITEAAKRADLLDKSRPRYNLLVTDGEPAGCSQPNPIAQTIAEITNARVDAGVKTFVLGVALGASRDNLRDMSVAGGLPKAGCDPAAANSLSCYYNATNASELQTALNAIQQAVNTELGTAGGCDETCYAAGCTSGQICKQAACVADPCASVTCGPNEACVEGTCRKFCTTACALGHYCDNGTCKEEVPCAGGCNGRNQICVGGACVENYCTGAT